LENAKDILGSTISDNETIGIGIKGVCDVCNIDINNPTSPIYFEPLTNKYCLTYRRNNYYYHL